MNHPDFDALLRALADVYLAEGREAADRTAQALTTTPAPAAFLPQDPCALDAMMRDLLASSAHPAAAAILAAQSLIPWGTNPVADRMSETAAAICAVTTLMGPEGPIPAPDLRLGLFYQRPDTYYALHNHDADETYVILAGSALWTAGDDIRVRGPGDYIHHPSLMPHAFRTGKEGVLALWRWSGDVNTHSYAFLPDAAA
ncbi:dimethylsulfonioproprionate lyase family protein [Albidovulum sediminicola]|uniref:Dimethylsulfonioproprionate lyase family protein n=1 Tax=Albidovulum sediminicola TaxID=2984331 RepID=A0ABT2YWE6_9RHOB|nr:dimethylsulfonioproprionate lyase family protein [Defluviimonas sp. WL0075]MCV2863194.1 dimethylsulfonioproprionate lyase family protein [Defluviimonas sp. WL0075]